LIEKWAAYANWVHYVGTMEAGVAELKAGHIGLVVLVNKYDGVDLAGKACELLILDGVPRPLDAVEQRESVALSDSPARLAREFQRIEQGMGRGVRDTDDYCAVLLLGADLGIATYDALISACSLRQPEPSSTSAGTSRTRSRARVSMR
jgi:Helicase C-terminal domain